MNLNQPIPFEKASYFKILPIVWAVLAIGFTIAVTFFGYELTNADVPGALIAGAVGAYLVHLLIDK
jgi:hypothetical protein